jgi:hypothetical protein
MPAYDEDLHAWAFEQARFLREGRFDLLDIEHVADEIESLAKEEVRDLIERMSVLLAKLLEWSYLPAQRTSRCSALIEARRLDVVDILDDSPSLRAAIDVSDTAAVIWHDALAHAATEIELDSPPSACPWPSWDVLSEGWLPASTPHLLHFDLDACGRHVDATYLRVGGRLGQPIRYRRTNISRRRTVLPKKVQARIASVVLVISVLSPDFVGTILLMPAAAPGRMVKTAMRGARAGKRTRRLVKRRPVSTVFRVPALHQGMNLPRPRVSGVS